MPAIVIPDLDEALMAQLRGRAAAHGRSPEGEARAILQDVLRPASHEGWAEVNALRERLAASGRTFSDSAELVREDRDR